MRFRERMARFMVGRNGNDGLNLFLLVSGLVALVLGSFLKGKTLGALFSVLAVAAIAFAYFRLLSKNLYKRRAENEKYLALRYRVLAKARVQKERWIQRKEYKFFTCPSCHTTLRVPRGRGKIQIVCRKCGNTFIGKS